MEVLSSGRYGEKPCVRRDVEIVCQEVASDFVGETTRCLQVPVYRSALPNATRGLAEWCLNGALPAIFQDPRD